MKRMISWKTFAVTVVAGLGLCLACPAAFAAKDKPNILVIWGDDVGYWNISAYNQGMMGYETPNIDSVASQGRCSPTGTPSRAVPPEGRPSSSDNTPSAPVCLPSGCRDRPTGSVKRW